MELLLKLILCSGLFWVFYKLFLQKEKMPVFNRYFLLTALMFSVAIPFMKIQKPEFIRSAGFMYEWTAKQAPPVLHSPPTVISPAGEIHLVNEGLQPVAKNTVDLYTVFIGVFLLITAVFLLRFLVQLTRMIIQTRRYQKIEGDGFTLVLHPGKTDPYSFLHFIFLSEEEFQKGQISLEIIAHERAHICQRHSLDVLAVELLKVLFWFNPFFYLFKYEIQLNHEFLADSEVLKNNRDPLVYKKLLLERTAHSSHVLSSSFSYKSTKKRIIMMSKNTSKTKSILLRFLCMPLLVMGIFLFSQSAPAQQVEPGPGAAKKEMRQFNRSIKKIERKIEKAKGGTVEFEIKNPGKLLEIYEKMSPEQRESIPELKLPEISINAQELPFIKSDQSGAEISSEEKELLEKAEAFYTAAQPFYAKALEQYELAQPFYKEAQVFYTLAQEHYRTARNSYEESRLHQLKVDGLRNEMNGLGKESPEFLRLQAELTKAAEELGKSKDAYKAEMKIYSGWMEKYGEEMAKYGDKMADYNMEMGKYSLEMGKYGEEMRKYSLLRE